MGPSATLTETLAAWRLDRSSAALANRVDDAGARVPMPPLPSKLQRWWTDRARTYDPETASILLATLHVQAHGGNVSWRTVMLRDTPVARALRANGFEGAAGRDQWLNLLDRIGLLLRWPDDPRVAMALAGWIRVEPFQRRYRMHPGPDRFLKPVVDAIVRRIIEIGDVRALVRVAPLRTHFSGEVRAALERAMADVSSPRTTDDTLEDAWHAVIDEPFDLSTRLVLADAYLERGDPRGELIALQCAPFVAIDAAQAAGRPFDRDAAFGVGAERIAKLVEEHWYRWFGELSLVVTERSVLRAGLLARIWIGQPASPAWAWPFTANHRELCALEEVVPLPDLEPEPYIGFLRALPRQPRWVHLRDRSLAVLRGQQVPFVGVRYTVGPRDPLEITHELVAIAPKLERLRLSFAYPQHMDAIHEVVAVFPQIKIEMVKDGW
jgi:uncharacterized protein (TIGR02996 family)